MKILLCVLSNDNHIPYFPLGVAYLASSLRRAGHEISIYSEDVHHYDDEHLTRYLDRRHFDIVGVGSISGYYPYKRLKDFSQTLNKSTNRKNFKYVLGGHMPSADPKYFLNKMEADVVIVGEADITITKLTNAKIQQGEIVENLDKIPFPLYRKFPIEYYRLQRFPNIENHEFSMSMISGRGCSFHCTFCQRLTPGIRLRSIKSIVKEIEFLKKSFNITYIDFADDLTFASKERTIELAEALLPLNIKWRCEGRLNYVDKELLKLVKRAGCVFINYGIESLDDNVLATMKKALTVSQIISGIETTIDVDISPGLNIMWGNIGDTKETLQKAVDFLIKYDDCSQMRTISPVTPFPGCELFETAKKLGKLKDTADFYENKYKNSDLISVNFTELSDDEFYKALYDANFTLLCNYYKNKTNGIDKKLKKLYIERNPDFRGWRHQ